jgi:hypothetical protein
MNHNQKAIKEEKVLFEKIFGQYEYQIAFKESSYINLEMHWNRSIERLAQLIQILQQRASKDGFNEIRVRVHPSIIGSKICFSIETNTFDPQLQIIEVGTIYDWFKFQMEDQKPLLLIKEFADFWEIYHGQKYFNTDIPVYLNSIKPNKVSLMEYLKDPAEVPSISNQKTRRTIWELSLQLYYTLTAVRRSLNLSRTCYKLFLM